MTVLNDEMIIDTLNLEQLIKKIENNICMANQQYYRSSSAMSPFALREYSKDAIHYLMLLFLSENGISIEGLKSYSSSKILFECSKLNSRFEEIDLSVFQKKCYRYDMEYCNAYIEMTNDAIELIENLLTEISFQKIGK